MATVFPLSAGGKRRTGSMLMFDREA